MKLAIARDALLRAVSAAQRAVEARNTIPILANLRLVAAGETLTVSGTDLDVMITSTAPATVATEGAITAPADKLSAIARKLACETVNLSLAKGVLTISGGRSRFTLQTLAAGDFPDLAPGLGATDITLPSGEITRLVAETSFAISTEETRYYLNGVFLHGQDGKIRGVATDGHRLALSEITSDALPETGVIIPRKTVAEIAKLAAAGSEVRLSIARNKIGVVAGDTVMTSKLIDGTFPDYTRVIPRGNDNKVTVDLPVLSAAVDRVSTVSSERGHAMKLTLSASEIALEMRNADAGTASEVVSVDHDGADLTIGFNSRYLADLLKVAKGDTVTLALGDPGSPALITASGAPGWLGVLMPMRVS